MKNKKLKRLEWTYAMRGLVFGLVVALVVFLLAADSDAYHESDRTLADFIHCFPAFWVMVFLPILSGVMGYWLARQMCNIIREQKKTLKEKETMSDSILKFVEGLSAGNLDIQLDIDDRKDELAVSLKKLQTNLSDNAAAERKRSEEADNRTWVTNGVAQIAETLRRNNDNMAELSYNIINFLVEYVKLNQAGFFLLHTGDEKGDAGQKFYELTAFIAYERKKYCEKRIEWGDGLVGRCGQERKTIYMTDLPENYINVTSGLGDASPRALLLVPLKTNDEIYGVIEMATLQHSFQEHEIEFLEKTAESIAMTISTVKTNIQTNILLQETRQQAAKMKEQEETMRQNIEEMQATQEENERKEIEMKGFIDAINHASISCHFLTDGTITDVNDNFLKTFGYKREEVIGQNMGIFFFKTPEAEAELDNLLNTLRDGNTFNDRVRRRSKRGDEIWLLSTYTPVVDSEGEVLKVISLENDIADQVKLEREMQDSKRELDIKLAETRNEVENKFKQVQAVKIRNEKTLDGMLDAIITTNEEGVIEFFNVAAEKLWGYDRAEVLNQNVSMLFSQDCINSSEFVKAFVTTGAPKIIGDRKEVTIKNKFGEEVPVLVLLSEAEVENDHSFTAFIQNVEVELF